MNRNRATKLKIQSLMKDDESQSYKLHNLLSVKQIVAMKERFEKHGRHMSRETFKKALEDIGHIIMTDSDFDTLCKKLNYNRTLTDVYWREFLTHIIVGLNSESTETFSDKLELPITGSPKELRSHHRLPVSRIIFIPEIQQDRIVNHLYGVYATCSREGLINYWSMDMEYERTVYSKSPKLKSQQTWITDIVSLPDVSVICTCSTERDLRFYDTTAKKFELRVYITSLEEMITAMYYTFYADVNNESKLIVGNSSGKVIMILINPKDRGPFKSLPKTPLRTATYQQFLKGHIIGMKVNEIPTEHTDWVREVSFYESINCTISISSCSKQSMLIASKVKKDCNYSFSVPKGFSCFAIADELHMVITGGADCLIRAWNPFLPSRAVTVFQGHHAGIVSVTLQDNRILVSLDKDKCIKVWDVTEQQCLQSYFGLPSSLGERTPLCTYYNPGSRQLFVASIKIAHIQVYPLLNGEYTDGITHSKEVSVILYNKLHKAIVTCGFDSFIIMWNPWTGKRIQFIRHAHTSQMYGETVPVEITAAAFDPSEQFLITGASDGTLKVWNFIIKTFIRNMSIERYCEIYSIVWLKYRILVMGENRVVTEFADVEDIGSSNYKCWMRRHDDDILCAALYLPQTLVTGSYGGELVFWRLETGQPYGIYNVANPSERIKQKFQNKIKAGTAGSRSKPTRSPALTKKYVTRNSAMPKDEPVIFTRSEFRESLLDPNTQRISVNAMTCLTARAVHPQIGTLMVALDNGVIQIWSIHPGGGYITSFQSVHTQKDFVVSLTTDQDNNYLFTGHMSGYIKTWHLVNYATLEENCVHICMPKLRLQFPFLWKDFLLGRAKRAHRENKPLLLNSFKAHLKPVTGLVFIDQVQIIISCSSDGSSRIWTLGGRYMGTLGTFKPWTLISPTFPPDDKRQYPLPADIQRSCSFTSIRVLSGGTVARTLSKKQQQQQFEQMGDESTKVYGKRVNLESILGKHFSLPTREFHHYDIVLDTSLPDVPIYSEMIMPLPKKIERPPTPDLIKSLKFQRRLTTARVPLHRR